MKSHFKYLGYILRHKWYVFAEGLRVGAPFVRLVLHDWTKLLPREWFPYVAYFYGSVPIQKWAEAEERFAVAWNHHQKANPHHWQYWLLTNDSSEPKQEPLEIPDSFVREMIADWAGAGRAITGKTEVRSWYERNREQIILHPLTREKVETLLASCYAQPGTAE